MAEPADLLRLLRRFAQEGVQYVLIGGHAVRINGFVRSTEDIDILLPSSVENGRKVIRALSFLASSSELDPEWFAVDPLAPHIRRIMIEDTPVQVLDIQGLLKTKTDYREKDQIDKAVLARLQAQLGKR